MRRPVPFATCIVLVSSISVVLAAKPADGYPIVVVHGSTEGSAARSGTMTLLDHDTFDTTATVSLPMQPRPMGFDASGGSLIVLGQSAARATTGVSTRPWRLYLVDVASGKYKDLGEIGLPPVGFARSEETNRAYLIGGVKKKGSVLTMVDLDKRTVIQRIAAPEGRPTAILGPGSTVLFAEFGYGEERPGDPEPQMLVFDADSLNLLAAQALDPSPRRPVLSSDGSYVYVTSSGGLFVFDAKSGRLAAKVATGPGTKAVVLDAAHDVAWVVSAGSGSGPGVVTAVRGDKAVGRIELSVGYGNVFPVPASDLVLVMGKRAVHAVSAASFETTHTWDLDFEPAYAVLDAARGRAWIAAGYGSDVAAIDLARGEVVARLEAGRPDHSGKYSAEPGSLVMTLGPDGRQIFLANTRTDDVTVVNADTLAVEETIATGGRTESVLASPGGSCMYVVGEDQMVRIDPDTLQAVPQCARVARSGLAGVVSVHNGVALIPQEFAVEFLALDDGRSLGRKEFKRPVDSVFVTSPEK